VISMSHLLGGNFSRIPLLNSLSGEVIAYNIWCLSGFLYLASMVRSRVSILEISVFLHDGGICMGLCSRCRPLVCFFITRAAWCVFCVFTLHASGVFFITHAAWCVFLCLRYMTLACFFITRAAWCVLFCWSCFALLFLLGATLFTSLYKHHEAAISLEHIYSETP
jgi:hypothetical protein